MTALTWLGLGSGLGLGLGFGFGLALGFGFGFRLGLGLGLVRAWRRGRECLEQQAREVGRVWWLHWRRGRNPYAAAGHRASAGRGWRALHGRRTWLGLG